MYGFQRLASSFLLTLFCGIPSMSLTFLNLDKMKVMIRVRDHCLLVWALKLG